MFFLILFSILQTCFLPGFILFIILNRKSIDCKILMVPVYSFALSLIVNYVLIIFLSYFHIYTRLSLTIILVIEFAFLIIVFAFQKLNTGLYYSKRIYSDVYSDIRSLFEIRKSVSGAVNIGFFILSILVLFYLLVLSANNIGKIFQTWDAVFSWNRWAIDFSNNKLPWRTYHYPQLLPANWSITYVLFGYPLQFIPRIMMPFFLILQVYSFIVTGLIKRSGFFFFATFLLILGFNVNGYTFNWTDGCADVPVAFFSILVFITLFLSKKEDNEADKKKYILLSALFVCGAAVTKQAGLFMVIIYPLFLYNLTRDYFVWTRKNISDILIFSISLLFIIVMPHYLYTEVAIRKGLLVSEVGYVTNEIYHGASYAERLLHAWSLFYDVFARKIIFLICLFPFLASFTNRTFRALNLYLVVPYFLLWALFFSYDIRNSALLMPYFCLSIGAGFAIILKAIKPVPKIDIRIKIKWKIIVPSAIIILVILAIFGIKDFNEKWNVERLKFIHIVKEKKNGEEAVNQQLFLYNSQTPIEKFIITDYQYLWILPEISMYFKYGEISKLEPSSRLLNDKSNGYLLYTPNQKEMPPFIEAKIASGQYKEIFSCKEYRFIKIF